MSVYLSGLFGQVLSQTSFREELFADLPDFYNERFYLMTDRYIYAVGERILFKAFNISHPDIQKESWSKVLYIELIKPDGTVLEKAKFPLSGDGADGYIQIPENLLTGNYYVVVYTRWMRNFSPGSFTYNMIKVINPYSTQLEESCIINRNQNDSIIVRNETIITGNSKPALNKDIIICETNKKSYLRREEVIVDISIPTEAYLKSTVCCMFVVRPGVSNALDYSFLLPDSIQDKRNKTLEYIPEIRGLSISGKVISHENNNPLLNAHVQLLVMGDYSDYYACNTKGNGSFSIGLNPIEGNHEMFIMAEHFSGQSLEILIDDDFSEIPVKFNGRPFILSSEEKEKAGEIMFNMQIGKFYKEENAKEGKSGIQATPGTRYYGKPSNVVNIDDYIELPTLEEVFIELVPEVYPVIRRNKTQLIIRNEHYSQMVLSIDPLILVDHIPISNLKEVLSLSPSLIQRIEVVNDLFIVGDIIYGGIISIFTESRNLAGIKLPENSYFFTFQHFEDQDKIEFPVYSDEDEKTNLPDYRNCLYWDPDLQITPSITTRAHFYTSDAPGEYVICVRGINSKGEIVEGTCSFSVEK